ncbi:unnamed protein product [Hapterophycus canaliculatus]
MVINCVPTPKRRYQMLSGYRKHLRDGGHLFLMLPLLCLTKSTWITRESFLETLTKIGFALVARKESPKVAFFCLTTATPEAKDLQGSESRTSDDGEGASAQGAVARPPSEHDAQAKKRHAGRRNRGGNDFAVHL